jgi:hypothetical protein
MEKTIAGIVRQKWTIIERQYYCEALSYYDEVIYIDPREVCYELVREDKSVKVIYKGYCLNNLSMLYAFGYAKETLLLVKCLAMCGVPSSDPYHTLSRDGLGKVADLLHVLKDGVGTSGHILTSLESAVAYIDSLEETVFPLLRKPIDGNRGRGIKKLETREEALKACKAHFSRSADVFLLEKFMNYRREYRVYVVDGAPVEAYERLRAEGRVAGNLSQGGSAATVDDETKQRLFALVSAALAGRFQLGIYGVDVALTDTDDVHILEVNRTPGFGGLAKLKLPSLPRCAHERIRKRARPYVVDPETDTPAYTITIVGDTNPGDSYVERAEASGRVSLVKKLGIDNTFANFREFLAESDYTLANLEVCLTNQRDSALAGRKTYLDRADVQTTIQLLQSLNISVVSLANNHVMDFGEAGLNDTVSGLKSGGVAYFGAGNTDAEARDPVHHTIKIGNRELSLLFAGGLQYMKNHDGWKYYAAVDRPGINCWHETTTVEQISTLRRQNPHAFIIAYPHWGTSYAPLSDVQKKLGRAMIDSGANLVVGHGSHMLQEIEQYKGRWIIYSIGNFVYNAPGRFEKFDVLPFGLIGRLHFYIENTTIKSGLRLYPILSDNKRTQYQPNFVSYDDFSRIIRFYMPLGQPGGGIASLVRTGRDKFGYHLSLDIGICGHG